MITSNYSEKMADRFGAILASAGAGAIATIAGIFVARKVKRIFSSPPEMKMGDKRLKLSTRCSWLISGEYTDIS